MEFFLILTLFKLVSGVVYQTVIPDEIREFLTKLAKNMHKVFLVANLQSLNNNLQYLVSRSDRNLAFIETRTFSSLCRLRDLTDDVLKHWRLVLKCAGGLQVILYFLALFVAGLCAVTRVLTSNIYCIP